MDMTTITKINYLSRRIDDERRKLRSFEPTPAYRIAALADLRKYTQELEALKSRVELEDGQS